MRMNGPRAVSPVADLRAKFSPDLKGMSANRPRSVDWIDEISGAVCRRLLWRMGQDDELRGVKELRRQGKHRIERWPRGCRAKGSKGRGPDWWGR